MASATAPAPNKSQTVNESETKQILEEQIRSRAHELWLERGMQDGSALDDWVEAEREIQYERED